MLCEAKHFISYYRFVERFVRSTIGPIRTFIIYNLNLGTFSSSVFGFSRVCSFALLLIQQSIVVQIKVIRNRTKQLDTTLSSNWFLLNKPIKSIERGKKKTLFSNPSLDTHKMKKIHSTLYAEQKSTHNVSFHENCAEMDVGNSVWIFSESSLHFIFLFILVFIATV